MLRLSNEVIGRGGRHDSVGRTSITKHVASRTPLPVGLRTGCAWLRTAIVFTFTYLEAHGPTGTR